MKEQTTGVLLFGQRASIRYSEAWFGYAVLLTRVVMGWILFYSGVTKLLDPAWTAEGFLLTTAGVDANPLSYVWVTLAQDWLWLVDPLNAWGLTLIGLSLLLGALVRIGSAFGILLMFIYYLASLPLEWGFIVDYHIVYALLMFGVGAAGAGRLLGLDHYLENNLPISRPWARLFLG